MAKLLRLTYVDDVVTSVESEEQAYELYVKSRELLKQAGFNLRKFASNSRSLQSRVDSEESESPPVSDFKEPDESYSDITLGTSQKLLTNEQKVLGMRWNMSEDKLVFSLHDIAELAKKLHSTKRNVVSLIGKFYDPLGFLSPIVVKYKIFMQALCEAKMGWDDVLTGRLLIQWNNLVSSLDNTPQMQIPRSYLDGIQENILSYTLCGYCDASLSAYAAVVYLRSRRSSLYTPSL